ncbi:Transposase DDE domain protein [Gemmata sp. SH-PL17]|uniref:ISAs1 family transposase n=1 Tax=Gemmata sp. SH-PL17 TaxID=1630693 RepID=UPI00078CBE04|nr:ISAs1 family transposase [Gemmata sp. SH-PL17]AMV26742.1 Transposase DDE domain protein [Gemmata sp. SH-PL17]
MPLSLTAVFADVPDPRIETANKLHPLTDILVIATCAVIAGADGWDEIAEYARTKEPFFRRFLELPNGVPSHDTFERVFAKLDPDAFADRFGRWVGALCESTGLVHIAIDGKSARRSAQGTFTGCLHLVNAWATENNLFLGQVPVPNGSNEIAAVPELLKVLDLRGALVTLDDAFGQKDVVTQIREQGGAYLVTVKGNQPTLHRAVVAVFEKAAEAEFAGCDMAGEAGVGHGREEERYSSFKA